MIDSWIAIFDDVISRHSRGLQSIVFTLSQSVPELGLLIMILIISGLIFASLTYYIEMVSSQTCKRCLTKPQLFILALGFL